jgi:hypothetical protein
MNFSLSRYIYLSYIIILPLDIANIKKYALCELQPLLIRWITFLSPNLIDATKIWIYKSPICILCIVIRTYDRLYLRMYVLSIDLCILNE